ncbi:MAG: hypothetical protein HWN65_08490 [Candidatus Helarchaeota archaeon]|nr:hypothetical protein [Candidatus Helarchaeota archaeon]
MFRDIWIIEKLGGRCLYHRSYGAMKLDPDLLSSFLTGLNAFSEAELGDTGIESIEMGNMKWVYINWRGQVLAVAAADKQDDATSLNHQLHTICTLFLGQFGIDEDENYFRKWGGNVTAFDQFSPKLEELMQSWEAVSKVTDIAKFMNLLEVYQQIFHAFAKVLPSIKPEGQVKLANKMNALIEKLPIVFQNISYGKTGWDILSVLITASNCTEKILRDGLQFVLESFINEMKAIFKEELFFEIAKKLVYPKILADWVRIRELEIDNFLLKIFLS